MLKRLFTAHPASVGESYWQHQARALSFGARLLAAGAACLLHAVLPFLFVTAGSRAIRQLHDEMVTHRRRAVPGEAPAARGEAA